MLAENDRLTHRRTGGLEPGYWSPAKKQELIDRLAEYEDIGLTPQQIIGLLFPPEQEECTQKRTPLAKE